MIAMKKPPRWTNSNEEVLLFHHISLEVKYTARMNSQAAITQMA